MSVCYLATVCTNPHGFSVFKCFLISIVSTHTNYFSYHSICTFTFHIFIVAQTIIKDNRILTCAWLPSKTPLEDRRYGIFRGTLIYKYLFFLSSNAPVLFPFLLSFFFLPLFIYVLHCFQFINKNFIFLR